MDPALAAYLLIRAAAHRRCDETTRQALRHCAEHFSDRESKRIGQRAFTTMEPSARAWFQRLAT
jgi:hypothetical protein